MEGARYVDELIDEYLLYRGFIKTFSAFSAEKATAAVTASASSNSSGGGSGGGGGTSGSGGNNATGASSSGVAGGGGSSGSVGSVANVPTSVDALVSLLVAHVRALDLDALQDCWAVMHSKFFVHLESAAMAASTRSGPSAAGGVGGFGTGVGGSVGAPSLSAGQGASLGSGLARNGGGTGPASLAHALRSMEQSLKKALLVRCVQRGARDKLQEAFDKLAAEMLAPPPAALGANATGVASVGDSASVGSSLDSAVRSDYYGSSGSSSGGGGSSGTALYGTGGGGAGGAAAAVGMSAGNGWEGWLALLYLPSPDQSAQFGSYFSKRWFATLVASVHNLLSAVFRALPLPSLLAFNVERERRRRTNGELRNLRAELERTRLERDQAQVQLARLRSQGYRVFQQQPQQQQRGVSHPQPALNTTTTTNNNASNAMTLQSPLPLVAAPPRSASSSSATSSSVSGAAAPASVASGTTVPFARGGGESVLPTVSSSSLGEEDVSSCFAATSEPHVLLGHPGPVSKVRFNNEGSALLSMANNAAFFHSGNEDGTTTVLSPPSSASSPREEDEEVDHSSSSGAVTQLWDMSALLDTNRRGGGSPRKSPQRRQQSLSLFQRAEDDARSTTPTTMMTTPAAPSARRATYSATMPSANNSINNPFASPLRAQQQQQQQPRAVSISPGRSASASVASQSGFVGSSASAGDEQSAGGDVAEEEDEDGSGGDAGKSLLLRPYGSIAHATPLASVAWSKSDSYILTGSAIDGKVGVWQLLGANKTGVVQQQQQAGKAAKLLAEFVSPDALGSPGGGGSGGGGMSCPVVLDLATSPGDRFFVASWAQATSREWTSLGSPSSSGSLDAKLSSGGGSVQSSSSSAQGFLELWDLASGKRSTVFALPGSSSSLGGGGVAAASPISSECTQINSLSLNHNGNMLVTGGADGVVRVWDTRASAAMAGWLAHPHALASSSSSGSKGGGGGVACVRLCADETTLLSVGCDGAVVEWSLHRMGNVLRRVAQPPRPLPPIPTSAAATAPQNQNPDPVGEYYARPELALDGEARHGLLSGGVGWAAWTTTTHHQHSRRSSVVTSYDHEQDATGAGAGHATSSYAALLFPLPPISTGNASGAPPSPSSSSSGDPATAATAAALPTYSSSTSSPLQRLHLHAGPVLSVDWHPTAAIFATGAADHTARIVCGRTR